MVSITIFFTIVILCAQAFAQQTTYTDIVIVGAGTSGCVLAARLCAALPFKRIHLLERGLPRDPETDFLVRAPRKLYDAWSVRTVTEAYQTEKDAGINGRTTTVLTGGTLGGTSTIGGFQWVVPIDGSVEQWGIRGLTTPSSKPYYQRGFIQRKYRPPPIPLNYADDYVDSAVRAGFPRTSDPLSQGNSFIWQNRVPIDERFRRVDTCETYIKPVQNNACRFNLNIVQGVTASKLLYTKQNGKLVVNGVETLSTTNGIDKQLFYASTQVILSAGPYNTPKLMQLSGIGILPTLQYAGIQQTLNLPVGESTICGASAVISSTYTGVPDEPANNLALVNSPQQRAIWDAGKGGILAVPPVAINGRNGSESYFNANYVPFTPGPASLFTGCYPNTRTRGFVRVRDSNPFSVPFVKYNLLGNQVDIVTMSKCLNEVANIHRSFPPSFKMKFSNPPDGIITEKWIRENSNTGAHFLGGCPVGPVLTDDLRVKNTIGLRVIDASVFREMPLSGGPVASVQMIAEYMSDMLIKEFK